MVAVAPASAMMLLVTAAMSAMSAVSAVSAMTMIMSVAVAMSMVMPMVPSIEISFRSEPIPAVPAWADPDKGIAIIIAVIILIISVVPARVYADANAEISFLYRRLLEWTSHSRPRPQFQSTNRFS